MAATEKPDTCRFDVTGSVDGNFNESDQTLNIIEDPELTPGANLTISEVVGCFELWNNGEDATFRMSYALSNAAGPIAISSP